MAPLAQQINFRCDLIGHYIFVISFFFFFRTLDVRDSCQPDDSHDAREHTHM